MEAMEAINVPSGKYFADQDRLLGVIKPSFFTTSQAKPSLYMVNFFQAKPSQAKATPKEAKPSQAQASWFLKKTKPSQAKPES